MNVRTTQHSAAPVSEAALAREDRRRRSRALLAGGLVLGIGAAVTLAAWSDSEFATGTFAAGTFGLEGSTNGSTFAEHDTDETAATVAFAAPFQALSPDDVVYAPFWVRLDDRTTSGAGVTVASLTTEDGTPGNAANLSWSIYQVNSSTATCGPGVAEGTPVASGETLESVLTLESEVVALAPGEGSKPGAAVELCVVVTAGADLVQGGSAVATWEFTAVATG